MAAPPASNFFYHTRARNQKGQLPPRPFRPNGPKPSPPFNRTNNTSSNAPHHQRQPNRPPNQPYNHQSGPSNPRSQRPSGNPHYKSNSGISKPAPRKPYRDSDGDISMTDVFVKSQPQKRQPTNPPPTKNNPNTGRKANTDNINTPHQYRRGTLNKSAPKRPFSKDFDGDTPMFDILDMAPTPTNLPVTQPIQLPCYPVIYPSVDFDGDSMMLEAF
ncbi:hypothetical protein AnigIFM56816_002145 [Aspergillus niger]|nr:hypothetical protein AnigIFM56816_002145 [Aspergillus niger]